MKNRDLRYTAHDAHGYQHGVGPCVGKCCEEQPLSETTAEIHQEGRRLDQPLAWFERRCWLTGHDWGRPHVMLGTRQVFFDCQRCPERVVTALRDDPHSGMSFHLPRRWSGFKGREVCPRCKDTGIDPGIVTDKMVIMPLPCRHCEPGRILDKRRIAAVEKHFALPQ